MQAAVRATAHCGARGRTVPIRIQGPANRITLWPAGFLRHRGMPAAAGPGVGSWPAHAGPAAPGMAIYGGCHRPRLSPITPWT
ncbi:protein of unknown function (plasmid) [Cupriavidus taiwanensis]|uniref:Uncharacterized protein n=1 Tax=Cupriavidus taiwanensis TaxID=164546 RepID=A0A375IS48_9BURK|nr:protein of unknown function [Cupriavidus taiwanensis]